jgi:hypothetical protein
MLFKKFKAAFMQPSQIGDTRIFATISQAVS